MIGYLESHSCRLLVDWLKATGLSSLPLLKRPVRNWARKCLRSRISAQNNSANSRSTISGCVAWSLSLCSRVRWNETTEWKRTKRWWSLRQVSNALENEAMKKLNATNVNAHFDTIRWNFLCLFSHLSSYKTRIATLMASRLLCRWCLPVQALCRSNLPKLLERDRPIFTVIMGDLFPRKPLSMPPHDKLHRGVIETAKAMGLQPVEEQTLKVDQLHETLEVKSGLSRETRCAFLQDFSEVLERARFTANSSIRQIFAPVTHFVE